MPTIRCPICGHGVEVALAVGQLLRCPSCQTAFNAPLGSPQEDQPPATEQPLKAIGIFDKTPASQPDESQSPSELPPAGLSPSEPSPAADEPAAAVGGQPAIRDATGPDEDRAAETGPDKDRPDAKGPAGTAAEAVAKAERPPASDEAGAPAAEEDDRDAETTVPAPRGWTVWLVPALTFVSTVVVVLAILFRFFPRGVEPAADDANGTIPQGTWTAGRKSGTWSDASKFSQRHDRVSVRVVDVSFGAVVAKDLNREVIESDKQNYLQIQLEIRNRATERRVYTSWYGNVFSLPRGQGEVAALLFDDQKQPYQMMTFADVSGIRGHTPQAVLEPGDRIHDLLVFVLPEAKKYEDIDCLRLELPGEALGAPSVYRFEIPRSMLAVDEETDDKT